MLIWEQCDISGIDRRCPAVSALCCPVLDQSIIDESRVGNSYS